MFNIYFCHFLFFAVIIFYKKRHFVFCLQLIAYGIHPNTLAVTSTNAVNFRFQLSTYYNVSCLHRIIIGDGAILVPDSKSTAGKKEFFR